MIEEEIADHQNFEDSAEYLPYADDYEQLRPEEEQEDTDY